MKSKIANLRNSDIFKCQKLVNSRSGMTLLEIMVVLAILGSLIAIMAQKFAGAGDKANVKQSKIVMSQVSEALEMYKTDCGRYPESIEGLLQKDECKNWGPDAYRKKKEVNDSWGNQLIYSKNGSEFNLRSLGRDGQEGGEGYDADINLEDL